MVISQKNSRGKRIIEVSGALTVAGCLDLKKKIQENLRKGSRLELVIGNASEVDLAFLQVLGAANKTAEKGDREFSIRSPVPAAVVEGLKLSGFLNHNKCSKPGCIWCLIKAQEEGV